jgi:hypothetical protein
VYPDVCTSGPYGPERGGAGRCGAGRVGTGRGGSVRAKRRLSDQGVAKNGNKEPKLAPPKKLI